jgi:N-acetylmuramoyl-L-alanine amidase
MRKQLFIFASLFTGAFIVANVQALPAPNTLSQRERRAVAPRPTPTPIVRTRTVEVPEASRPSTVVVIDAGHGGFDRGGIAGQRVSEKMMNLDVAQRLKTVLQANGYRVVMTRDNDVFLPLGTRVAIANSYRDAIFVCVHFNATPRRSANGIETYFYSSQSLPLASAIHYYVNRVAPTPNRGVRRRGFYVLRNTRIPSVLVECGFLTNPTEAEYAQSAAYRQELADAIARGVRERSLVASTSAENRLAANSATVPLQPFIDQTRYHDPDLSRPRHRKKGSKSSSTSISSKRKKSSGSDSTAKSSTQKKKSSSAQTED